jgi:hypothetical protein
MTQLFHQLGHRSNWSIDSIDVQGTGDGLIIAPRSMEMQKVMALPETVRRKSFFDPQYFLPHSDKGKLSSYPFFPNVVADGFSTSEWDQTLAIRSATECVEFQASCDFKFIIIPTRFIEGMPRNYIDRQQSLFVHPFIEAYSRANIKKPLILELILTDQMLKDNRFRNDILNWVTGSQAISGVYLIYYINPRNKQIRDIEFLITVLLFIQSLKQAGMIAIVGYTNTESIPLLAANPDILTMGSYENLRMFNISTFENSDDQRRGPNARIYVAKLLQWIEHQYIGAISRLVGSIDDYIDDNEHRITMFQPSYKWHFTRPDPYKHYFISFSNQFRRLNEYNGRERLEVLKMECINALSEFNNLKDRGLVVDNESNEVHVASWINALNFFEKEIQE